MNGINSSWDYVDGTGIIVAVADSGLDSGTNDSTMHPILEITSSILSHFNDTLVGIYMRITRERRSRGH